jgi:UDP-3-O-[3-hydroxymyristoyl] glucosamine N-acyltransferase
LIAHGEVLDLLGARPDVAGSSEVSGVLTGVASLDRAGPRDLSFCTATSSRAGERLRASRAGMLIVEAPLLEGVPRGSLAATIVRSERARLDFIRALSRFFARPRPQPGIDPSAVIAPGARIGEDVTIGPLCTVADGAEIGGESVLYSGVHVYSGVRIGARVTIHAGTVIGADGFGFERNAAGELERFPHLGGVVIEDDVELGSNVCIDRGALDDTWIGPRVRIDNLVHVAHNVRIGADAAIVAHAMLAGSSTVGEQAYVAPCASLREGVRVGPRALVGIGAVAIRTVPDGVTVFGNPATILSYPPKRERAEGAPGG